MTSGSTARAILATAAALTLGACATGMRKPDVTLPAAYEAPPGVVALKPLALDRWWLIFGDDEVESAYPPAELDAWSDRLKSWAAGGAPAGLPIIDPGHAPPKTPRDVFAFIIHEGKVRAPAGAMALIERVGGG